MNVSYFYHFAYTVLIFDDGAQLHTHLQVGLLLTFLFQVGGTLFATWGSSKQAYMHSLLRKLMVHDLSDEACVGHLIVRLINIIVLLQQLLERLIGNQVIFFQAQNFKSLLFSDKSILDSQPFFRNLFPTFISEFLTASFHTLTKDVFQDLIISLYEIKWSNHHFQL